jgi:hypothetical protein
MVDKLKYGVAVLVGAVFGRNTPPPGPNRKVLAALDAGSLFIVKLCACRHAGCLRDCSARDGLAIAPSGVKGGVKHGPYLPYRAG